MPAFDAITSNIGNAKIRSLEHTVSGSSRYMLVTVTSNDDVASVTWMGVNLTRKVQFITATDRSEVWELAAPATGTDDVVVTFTVSTPAFIAVHTYTDVHQSGPTRSPVLSDVTSGTSHSFNVPSDTDELVVGIVNGDQSDVSNIVSGAGQTTRVTAGSANQIVIDDEAGASPNVSLDYSWTGSGAASFIGISLLPPDVTPDPDEEPGVDRPRFQSASSIHPAGRSTVLAWQHNHGGVERGLLLVGVSSIDAITHPLQGVRFRDTPLLFAGQVGNALGIYYSTAVSGAGEVRVPLGGTRVAAGGAISLSNANPPNPIAQIVTDFGTGSGTGNPTVTVPSATDQLVVAFSSATIASVLFTVEQTDQVSRVGRNFGQAFGPNTAQSGNMIASTRPGQAASTVMSWDASALTSWWVAGLAILPPQPGTVILGNQVVQEIRPQW